MRPAIDHDECIGDGICEEICPEVFELRDDGFAYVIDTDPPPELYGKIEEAIEACPTSCISAEED